MADSEITDVKRYDRQIRLWGLDTQRGLQGARILMLGVNGLSNEVLKNLALAGIGHVTIQDTGVLADADIATGALFSVAPDKLGHSRAKLLADQLKEMSPNTDFKTCDAEVSSLDADFLRGFHFIISARGGEAVREISMCTATVEGRGDDPTEPPAKRHRANGDSGPALARSNGAHAVVPMRELAAPDAPPAPRFLAAGCFGLDGFCFLDLGAPKAFIPPPKKTPAEEAAAPAAAPTGGTTAKVGYTEKALYPTIASASQVEWAALTNRVPRLYYALQLLHASSSVPVETVLGGAATPIPAAASLLPKGAPAPVAARLQLMLARRAELLDAEGTAEATKRVTPEYLAQVAQSLEHELAPVCAIVGGMVANEVIKVVSGKDRPINNAFFFDGKTSDGIVLRLGPSFDCPSGLDKGDFKKLDG